jgi:hypothetical protein
MGVDGETVVETEAGLVEEGVREAVDEPVTDTLVVIDTLFETLFDTLQLVVMETLPVTEAGRVAEGEMEAALTVTNKAARKRSESRCILRFNLLAELFHRCDVSDKL